MESTTEKSCLEEISHLVIDSEEKVSLKTISNNWDITNEVAKDVLIKWIDQNEKKVKHLVKEFLVRGINSNGKFFICVVSEEKKDRLEKTWKSFISWLYSIESKSTLRSLNVPDHDVIKIKNILIASGSRDFVVPDIPIIKVEPSTSKTVKPSPFAPKPSVSKKEVKIKNDTEIKKEADAKKKPAKNGPVADKIEKETKPSPPKPKKEKSPDVKEVKVEKTSPTETSAKKSPSKKGLKNQKPVGKGSITSFFNKPGASTSKSTTVKPPPEKSMDSKKETGSVKTPEAKKKPEIKEVTKEKPKKDAEIKENKKLETKKSLAPASKKRSLPDDDDDDDVIPATPEEPKKRKKQVKLRLKDPPPKRSRIKAIVDSSEEEEVESGNDEPESKYIKFDREFTPDLDETIPMEVEDSPKVTSQKTGTNTAINKRRAKRTVKKRYQTEDGFMTTETVIEEYTASEDENDENEKRNPASNTDKKLNKSESTIEKKLNKSDSNAKKAKVVAAAVPSSKTKQGSIMSFFNKK